MARTVLSAKPNRLATRRADLEEFVRLACVELASAVKGVAHDVEVLNRQTSIVQSALYRTRTVTSPGPLAARVNWSADSTPSTRH